VAVNLSASQQKVDIDYSSNKLSKSTTQIINGVSPDFEKNKIALQMPPYGIEVLSLKAAE
jgi:hypothetical protein